MSSTRRAWALGDSRDLTLSNDVRDGAYAWHPFWTKMTFVFQSEYSAEPLDNKNLALGRMSKKYDPSKIMRFEMNNCNCDWQNGHLFKVNICK